MLEVDEQFVHDAVLYVKVSPLRGRNVNTGEIKPFRYNSDIVRAGASPATRTVGGKMFSTREEGK